MGGVLGVAGFLENAQDFYEAADSEGAKWRALVTSWLECFGTEPVKAAELFTLPVVGAELTFNAKTHDGAKKEFGHQLLKQRDRWYGDAMISSAGRNRTGVQTYKLIHRDGKPRAGDPTAREQETVYVAGADLRWARAQ